MYQKITFINSLSLGIDTQFTPETIKQIHGLRLIECLLNIAHLCEQLQLLKVASLVKSNQFLFLKNVNPTTFSLKRKSDQIKPMCELKTIKFKGDNHQSFICGKLHSILWIMRKIQQKTAHALTELCVLCDIVTEHQITFIRSICTYIVSEKDAQTHSHTHTAEVC